MATVLRFSAPSSALPTGLPTSPASIRTWSAESGTVAPSVDRRAECSWLYETQDLSVQRFLKPDWPYCPYLLLSVSVPEKACAVEGEAVDAGSSDIDAPVGVESVKSVDDPGVTAETVSEGCS